MLMIIQLIILPLVAAFVGWVTNKLAIHLIFRPHQPRKIPLLPYTIQGLVPKRRAELARRVGQVVEQELLTSDDIVKVLHSPELLGKLLASIRRSVQNMIDERVPPWVPSALKNVLLEVVTEVINRQVPTMLTRTMEQLGGEIKKQFDVAALVESKLNEYPIDHVERIIVSVAARELKHIEKLGAVLGFIIGLLQFLFMQILDYLS